MLTARILVVSLLVAAVQAAPSSTGSMEEAKAICANATAKPITSPAQLAEIAGHIKEIECPQNVKEAAADLNELIANNKDNVCSSAHVNQIREFYASHVAEEMVQQELVQPLRDLFLSYVMRVSQGCKASMIHEILGPAGAALTERDYAMIRPAAAELGRFLLAIGEPSFMMLPSDLAAVVPHNGHMRKIVVDSSLSYPIAAIREACQKRFKPIYEPMVMPIAELTRAGFDYPDRAVRHELQLSKEDAMTVDLWTRAVFLCETVAIVEPTKQHEGANNSVRIAEGAIDDGWVHEAGEMEAVAYKPNTKVSISEIQPFTDHQLQEVLNNLIEHETIIERVRAKLKKSAIKMVEAYGKGEELHSILSCVMPESEQKDESAETEITAERQVCGRRGGRSFGTTLKYIFFASIIAIMMMMIAGG